MQEKSAILCLERGPETYVIVMPPSSLACLQAGAAVDRWVNNPQLSFDDVDREIMVEHILKYARRYVAAELRKAAAEMDREASS